MSRRPSLMKSVSTIQQYEQSGNYAAALKIARNSNIKNISQTKRLEKELLTLGSLRLLFDENVQPRVNLIQLLELVGMEPLNKSENNIEQINNWAQKNLLRQGERWQHQTAKFEELKSKIQPLLSELGFIDALFPHFEKYQGVIVYGALLPRARLRLYYLVEQWEKGVRFSQIYFLSGERPLEIKQENKDTFLDDSQSPLKIRKDWPVPSEFPKTEREMIQLIWEQSEIPDDMRKVEVYFTNAPMKEDAKGERSIRPTTDDTIRAWLQTAPPHGRYLAITNAPYINRQDVAMRAIAPCEYSFDTVGSAAGEREKMVIILDELARAIFQIKQISEG